MSKKKIMISDALKIVAILYSIVFLTSLYFFQDLPLLHLVISLIFFFFTLFFVLIIITIIMPFFQLLFELHRLKLRT